MASVVRATLKVGVPECVLREATKASAGECRPDGQLRLHHHFSRRNAVAAAVRVSPIRHARASFGNPRALTTWMVLCTTTDSETAVAVEEVPASAEPAAEPIAEATVEAAGEASEVGAPVEQKEVKRRTTGVNTRRKRVTVSVDQLVPGAQFTGKVRSIMAYGAFVDIGAITDGLVHISQLSYEYVSDVADVLTAGQEVTTWVIDADQAKGRISLTMKDPAQAPPPPAAAASGEGGEGGAAGERRGARRQARSDVGGEGEGDGERKSQPRQAGRGRRDKKDEQKGTANVKVGQKTKGVVKNLTSYGCFVVLEGGAEGLLRAEDIVAGGEMQPIESIISAGQEVEVTVTKVDRGRISLTMKEAVDVTLFNDTMELQDESLRVLQPFEAAFRRAKLVADTPIKKVEEEEDLLVIEDKGEGEKVLREEVIAPASLAEKVVDEVIEDIKAEVVEEVAEAAQVVAEELPEEEPEVAEPEPAAAAAAEAVVEEVVEEVNPVPEPEPEPAAVASVEAAVEEAVEEVKAVVEEVKEVVEEKLNEVKEEVKKAEDLAAATLRAAAAAASEAVAAAEAAVAEVVVPAPAAAAVAAEVPAPDPAAAVEEKSAPAAGAISAAAVKQLRGETGAGMMACKKALTETNGDVDAARELLRKKGLASAEKKSARVAAEGLVSSYVHSDRIGVLIEVNCETDFVARSVEFRDLVEDLGMQVAACPLVEVISVEDVPADFVAKERELEAGKEDLANKPEAVREKIVEGRVAKRLKELALLDQPYIKNDKVTVKDLVTEVIAKLGENIKIRRFERFNLGDGIEKKNADFAAEVAAASQVAAPPPPPAPAADSAPAVAESAVAEVAVPLALVKQLREETGAGMMDCKKALAKAGGDVEAAREALRKKGLASAEKRSGRIAAEGVIGSYIHDGRIGVLIEVNCETDFVSRGEKFKELVDDLAMQVAACPSVEVVETSDVDPVWVTKEREIEMGKEDLASKPEGVRSKIVEGRLAKRVAELALLEQAFIKNDKKLVKEVVKEVAATLGENIRVRRFTRFNLGEGIEKKVSDFAAEVAAAAGQA